MPASLKMLFRPEFMAKLAVIRNQCYTKISELSVSVATDKEPFSQNQGTYHTAKKGEIWAKGHSFTCAQFHITGKVPAGYADKDLAVITNITGEGIVYDKNGVPFLGMTSKFGSYTNLLQAHPAKTLLPLEKVSENGTIDFYIDAGYNGLRCMGIVFGVNVVKINRSVKEFYYDYLYLAYLCITYKKDELYDAADKAFEYFKKNEIDAAESVVKPIIQTYQGEKDVEFYAVGHSHLDLVWLWPKRETMRKSVRTFTNQINNIHTYDGYVYGASQPQQFAWIKEQQPELFEKIKEEIQAGRIEPQGAMWVEADTNLSGGEALVRQIKYGQMFWKENFGFRSDMCWLPDVFGYNGNLPQILSKSGVHNFMTIKLSWNNWNKFPYHTFRWRGIDNSEVLVHMPPSGNYNMDGTPAEWSETHELNTEPNVKKLLFEFGIGDGGGGPSELQLEMIQRSAKTDKPAVRFSGAEKFFEDLRKENYELPSYQGELYLEKHQGTYTTQGKMKKYNRKLEFLLENLERLWSAVYVKNGEYPQEKIRKLWEDVLFYQFHDSLPGSSIGRVYQEGNKHQEELMAEIEEMSKKAISILGGEKSLYNPAPVPVNGNFVLGDTCYQVQAQPRSSCTFEKITDKNTTLHVGKYDMENDRIRLAFESDGSFSLFDKEQKKDLGRFNMMRIYFDPRIFFNAWEIARWYRKLPHFSFECVSVDTKIIGNALIRTQELRFGHSFVKQKITIFADSKLVKIENTALLNRRHHQIRCDARPTVWADEVTCDIQYGNLKRTTKDKTSLEKARYEICSHKYFDLNDGKQGIAFLNDCKYGSRVKEGLVSQTLVRNPIYPDKKADRGEQTFTLAIYPYQGVFGMNVVEKAYALNLEPYFIEGTVPATINVSGDVVCEVIKKGDEGKTVAVRVYEPVGKETFASMEPCFTYKKVVETNLQEEGENKVDLNQLRFLPFEIKTFLFEL